MTRCPSVCCPRRRRCLGPDYARYATPAALADDGLVADLTLDGRSSLRNGRGADRGWMPAYRCGHSSYPDLLCLRRYINCTEKHDFQEAAPISRLHQIRGRF